MASKLTLKDNKLGLLSNGRIAIGAYWKCDEHSASCDCNPKYLTDLLYVLHKVKKEGSQSVSWRLDSQWYIPDIMPSDTSRGDPEVLTGWWHFDTYEDSDNAINAYRVSIRSYMEVGLYVGWDYAWEDEEDSEFGFDVLGAKGTTEAVVSRSIPIGTPSTSDLYCRTVWGTYVGLVGTITSGIIDEENDLCDITIAIGDVSKTYTKISDIPTRADFDRDDYL